MVTTTASDSSSNPAATTNFPRKNLASPWALVVRGADSSSSSEPLNNHLPPPPPPQSVSSSSSLDSANLVAAVVVDNNNSNANHKINNVVNANPKKPAWKNTSNGLVVAEVSHVMGAVSWPALSAKPSAKFTSAADGAGSISISQGPVTSNSPQKQATATATTANARHTPPMNHSHSVANRQKPMKRGGGNNNNNKPGPLSNSLSNPPQANHQPSVVAPPLPSVAPPFPVLQIPPNTFLVDGVQSYKNNNGWGPRSPVGGYGLPVDEHSHRGNFGHRPRNNYGTRRNQDPGNTMNTRDAHAPQHRMHSEGFLRPTLPNSAYLGSQPMRPFLNPAGFHEFYYYPTLQFEPFGGMPFLTHAPPPAMFFPVAEETPPSTPPTSIILKQIDYYFSDVNLANDEFLKSNMDVHGWVPISLIANFPRVKNLTNNTELILDSLRNSSVVEVNGDKLRKRNEWERFLPPVYQQVGSSSISSVGSTCNTIAADFDKITLDEATVLKHSDATTNGDSA